MVQLIATTRPAGDSETNASTLTVEAEDYQSAYAQVVARVPVGSVLLHVRVER
jgi:hypothetical protein